MLGIIEGLISIAKDLVSIAESVCKHSNKEKRLSHEQVVSLIRDYAKDICDDSPIVQLPAIEALIKLAEQYEDVRGNICNILCMFLAADSKSITFAETKTNSANFYKVLHILFSSDSIFGTYKKDISNCHFRRVKLISFLFEDTIMTNCEFTECYFTKVAFSNCQLNGVTMQDCNMKDNVSFTDCKMAGSVINNLYGRDVTFGNTSLQSSHITGSTFYKTKFDGVTFFQSHITNSCFLHCTFIREDLAFCHFKGVKFEYNRKYNKDIEVMTTYLSSLCIKYSVSTTGKTTTIQVG